MLCLINFFRYSAGFGFVLCTTMMLVLDWFYGLLGYHRIFGFFISHF